MQMRTYLATKSRKCAAPDKGLPKNMQKHTEMLKECLKTTSKRIPNKQQKKNRHMQKECLLNKKKQKTFPNQLKCSTKSKHAEKH